MEVDYRYLTRDITNDEIRHELISRTKHGWLGVLGAVIVIGFGLSVFFALAMQWPVWLIILADLAVAGLIVAYQWVHTRNTLRLKGFASDNGWQFLENQKPDDHNGMIFGHGHSRLIEQRFVLGAGWLNEMGNYRYVTGSGKNSQTHYFGYIRMSLPRKLPHMVLDAKTNNFLGISNLPQMFSRQQRLSLEGDFDKYFTLYAPQQYETDALYVFTPDVMATLIDDGQKYDLEVIDDKLYIYSSRKFNLSDAATIKKLLNMAQSIAGQLHEQTDYYADERVNDRAANIIAEPGRRLKNSVPWAVIIIVIVVILIQLGPMLWPLIVSWFW